METPKYFSERGNYSHMKINLLIGVADSCQFITLLEKLEFNKVPWD